jgi:integrase
VVPVLFRVVYCCGLWGSEALQLTVDDVALTTGTLHIRGTKGHKERYVRLAPDLWALCPVYDAQVRTRCPYRTAFFPNPQGVPCGRHCLDWTFHAVWTRAGLGDRRGNPPRSVIKGQTGPLPPDAVARFLHQYAQRARERARRSPHGSTRTCSTMHRYQAGMPLSYIKDFLGHARVNTTDIYASADVEMFRDKQDKPKWSGVGPISTTVSGGARPGRRCQP